ncbi:DUF4422 domain-containing protein [Candidatus Pelagibacter sp.]|nr:DUF4422 domain-containing protein [Candidatus Pelagibacter sp.]
MKSKNLEIYCITTKKIKFLKDLNLKIVVGGSYFKNENFQKSWFLDHTKINISKKNNNFGSLTSIYWIWKNKLNNYNDATWIGISHYRRFWLKEKHDKIITLANLNKNLLDEIPNHNLNYDAFIASPQNLQGYKLMKLLKKTPKNIFKNPLILLDKKKHNINLHFDMFHLHDGLKKAASVMGKEQQNDFLNFINTETELSSPFSIFILKKKKFEALCSSLFNWLNSCENIFNINKLQGHGQIRLFDYLAERYISYWIKKNTNYKISSFVFFEPELNNSFIIK